jgi:hypothetical protein
LLYSSASRFPDRAVGMNVLPRRNLRVIEARGLPL